MHLWDDEKVKKRRRRNKGKRWKRIECKVEYLFQAMLSHGVPLNSKHIKFHGLLSPFTLYVFFCCMHILLLSLHNFAYTVRAMLPKTNSHTTFNN